MVPAASELHRKFAAEVSTGRKWFWGCPHPWLPESLLNSCVFMFLLSCYETTAISFLYQA